MFASFDFELKEFSLDLLQDKVNISSRNDILKKRGVGLTCLFLLKICSGKLFQRVNPFHKSINFINLKSIYIKLLFNIEDFIDNIKCNNICKFE